MQNKANNVSPPPNRQTVNLDGRLYSKIDSLSRMSIGTKVHYDLKSNWCIRIIAYDTGGMIGLLYRSRKYLTPSEMVYHY